MTNIESFYCTVAYILTMLHESFPVKTNVYVSVICGIEDIYEEDSLLIELVPQALSVRSSVEWLHCNGYVYYASSTNDSFFDVSLTKKSFVILESSSTNCSKHAKTVGCELLDAINRKDNIMVRDILYYILGY